MSNKTLRDVRAWFSQNGISIADWAAANQLPVRTVYAVLGGRVQGNRGRSHQVAVALGLKDGLEGPVELKRLRPAAEAAPPTAAGSSNPRKESSP